MAGPQRRPPSLAAHWRDLRARPAAWLVIGRNLVPVVGVFALGWSVSLVIFSFWFDGLAGLTAIFTAVLPRAMRETREPGAGALKRAAGGVVAWAVMVVFVCLPYWIVLIPLHGYLLDPEMWRQIRVTPGLWAAFGGVAAIQLVGAFQRGYDELPERQLKQRLRWDAYLLILRAVAMFLLPLPFLPWLIVPALALLASYLEIWPAHALGAVWGDPERLGEDPQGGS
ncbi:MAG TPA: DUF6498-containing protein [Thermoanaerobaculia bacterium]|jgi:hypothetical protein|nr:DUF6498-containing protein [Thermoanaerobaculia bacterium]